MQAREPQRVYASPQNKHNVVKDNHDKRHGQETSKMRFKKKAFKRRYLDSVESPIHVGEEHHTKRFRKIAVEEQHFKTRGEINEFVM